MNKSLIFMLPIAFLMGQLGRVILTRDVEPKTTSKTRIKRDYFDAVPNENPEQKHEPDDDTHSVILEAVEKRLWKVCITEDVYDYLSVILSKKWFFVSMFLLISIYALVKELLLPAEPQEFHWAWEEKLDALLDPYMIQICTGIILLCIAWFIWTWLTKRLRLLKDIRNRNYECKIMTQEKPVGFLDGVLEVAETNAQEDCIRLELFYHGDNWTGPYYRAIIELMVERTSLQS